MIATLSFLACGIIVILLSIFMITRRQPVSAAMTLVVIMMFLAGMYGLLGANFSAVAQIIVYAGAIMVVFVFVIMILNLPIKKVHYGKITFWEFFIIGLSALTAILFGTKASLRYLQNVFDDPAKAEYFASTENVKNISALMFTKYLWAFEMISFLILVSVIGAVVIAKKEKRITNENQSS